MSDAVSREDVLKALSGLSNNTDRDYCNRAIRALPAVSAKHDFAQPDRGYIAFTMWKAEADRAAPNVGKHRIPSGFMTASEQDRDRWLGLADAVILALNGETP